MIIWKNRDEVSTTWDTTPRNSRKTKRRSYTLGSFFTLVKTIITDSKDDKALGIQCNPAYTHDNNYVARKEAD